MIHLALIILAAVVILWAIGALLTLAFSGFSESKGCGCFTLVLAAGIALVILFFWLG